MSVIVCAHNPMTGPRHLGHFGSTMATWPELVEAGEELFLVIDDLIAAILAPNRRHELQKHTMMTAAEFISAGLPEDSYHLLLTSMVPEIHEAAFFTGLALDSPYCQQMYGESFPGLLSTYERLQLGLARYPSVTETTYPQLSLATLILALGADAFQGGEEMLGYLAPLQALAEGLGIQAPTMLPGRSTFVLGTDGHHMATENALYLSADEDTQAAQVDGITDMEVLRSWSTAIGTPELLDGCADAGEARERLQSPLLRTLNPYRQNEITNDTIVATLQRGSTAARLKVRDFLIHIKSTHLIPGYTRG